MTTQTTGGSPLGTAHPDSWMLDLVAGVLYALAVHLALNRWDRRRALRPYDADAAAPDDLRERERLSLR